MGRDIVVALRYHSRATMEGHNSLLACAADEIVCLRAALMAAKSFHDSDHGCNAFTAEYELLRKQIDDVLALANPDQSP